MEANKLVRIFRATALTAAVLFSFGCEGPKGSEGDEGIEGPQGPAGAKGEPGSTTFAGMTDQLTDANVADNSISGLKIADGTLPATKIVAASIGGAQIADLGIDSPQLADLAVTTAKLSDSSVTAGKLDTTSVDGLYVNEGQSSAVTAAMIVDGTIRLADIAAADLDGTLSTELMTRAVADIRYANDGVPTQTGFSFSMFADGSVTPLAHGMIRSNGTVAIKGYRAPGTNVLSSWDATLSRYEITVVGVDYYYLSYSTTVTPTDPNTVCRTSSVSGNLLVMCNAFD